jgi:hypothetical protein
MVIGATAPYDTWLSRIKAAYSVELGAKNLIRQAKQGAVLLTSGQGAYQLLL